MIQQSTCRSSICIEVNQININIYTAATSGIVTTQYYGEQFRPQLVERKLTYNIRIEPPRSVKYNENVTLHYKVEKVTMTGLSSLGSTDRVKMNGHFIADDQTTAYTNFTPPDLQYKAIALIRDVSFEDVEAQKMDVMPGFRFSWWYTGEKVTPDKKYKDSTKTKQYVR